MTAVAAAPRQRHLGLALAIISAAQLMVVLDLTIVNVALPSIQRTLGFSPGRGRARRRAARRAARRDGLS